MHPTRPKVPLHVGRIPPSPVATGEGLGVGVSLSPPPHNPLAGEGASAPRNDTSPRGPPGTATTPFNFLMDDTSPVQAVIDAFTSSDPVTAIAHGLAIEASSPDDPAVLNHLGAIHLHYNQPAHALRVLRRAFELAPTSSVICVNLGLALEFDQQFEAAADAFGLAAAYKPDFVVAHFNRGRMCVRTERFQDATDAFAEVIVREPTNTDAWNYWAGSMSLLDRLDEALAGYERALTINPDHLSTLRDHAIVAMRAEQPARALPSLDRALAIDPSWANGQQHRGRAHTQSGRFAEAETDFATALLLDPGNRDALNGRAWLRHISGDRMGCLRDLEALVAEDPSNAEARAFLGLAYLREERFAEGWSAYESRWVIPKNAGIFDGATTFRWDGSQDLTGRSILVMSEQGFGDTIQFCRYVPMLVDRGARVILAVQPPLQGLIAGMRWAHHLVIDNTPAPDTDYFCPMLSLPHVFGTEPGTIPSPGRYLDTSPEKREAWSHRLGIQTLPPHPETDGGANRSPLPSQWEPRVGGWGSSPLPTSNNGACIGISWRGNPGNRGDAQRSIPLATFVEALPKGPRYVSLQKDSTEDERALLAALGIVDVADALEDFAETGAVCDVLDLIITVDTSIAHLAGALARPVWILLCRIPDWRWFVDRTDSPWYPTARLYRQATAGDWAPVITAVRNDLGSVTFRP